MAKVTIILTDKECSGAIDCSADFDQPGVSYEDMVANPTLAVANGLAMLKLLEMVSSSHSGKLCDEFGYEREVSTENPL